MNSITVCGYVGKVDFRAPNDPNGAPLMLFSVADNVYSRGKRQEQTIWWQCKLFGDKASRVCKLIQKGTFVVVAGAVRPDNYSDRQGQKHERFQIWVDQLEIKNQPQNRMDRPPAHDPSVTPFDQDDPDQGGGFDDDVPF